MRAIEIQGQKYPLSRLEMVEVKRFGEGWHRLVLLLHRGTVLSVGKVHEMLIQAADELHRQTNGGQSA